MTSALHGGGAERVIVTLADFYADMGDMVTILMAAGTESAYPLNPKVNVLSIGQPSLGNPVIQIKRLAAMRTYFKKHESDVIVSFGTKINLFTILASLGLGKNVVVSERNDPNRCNYKLLRNLIYSFGGRFIFQTEDAAGCFSKRIRQKSVVIPNPVRKELPESWRGIREKKIAAAGRLETQKNHKLLLEAFAGFHDRFPEWELHIFGKGKLEQELKKRAEELGIERRVFFEGFQTDILEKIKTYGMYVLSSDYEGISNSLMEAMAMGLPCISTDCPIGGSAMCIESGRNGLLVPVGDRKALKEAMEQIAGNEAFASELGKNAVSIRETFAEEKIADMWYCYLYNIKG